MTRLRDDPQEAARIKESTAWLFRKLMEGQSRNLEAAARELYAKEEQDAK